MQCYQCQAEIPDDAEFCIACGKPLARPATGPTHRIKPPPTTGPTRRINHPPPATGSTRLLNPPPALLQTLNDLPRKLRERIQAELTPTERISWIDQPVPFFFLPDSL